MALVRGPPPLVPVGADGTPVVKANATTTPPPAPCGYRGSMPPRNARPCPEWPCPHLKPCPDHGGTNTSREDRRNADRAELLKVYRSKRWKTTRRHYLEAHPWCAHHDGPKRCPLPATDVDHVDRLKIILEEGRDPYDWAELQPLCHAHHSSKTVRETGTSIDRQPRGRGGDRGEGVSRSRESTTDARPGSRAVVSGIAGRVVRRRVGSGP